MVDFKTWSKYGSKDIFNVFDIVAIKGSVVKFVQVKSNKSDFYSARKKVADWCIENGTRPTLLLSFEVWLKENNKDWRIWVHPVV